MCKEVHSNQKGYTILQNNILDNPILNMQEQSLLIAIISYYHKEKGYAYPNYEQLKLRSKIKDNRTLNKNIKSLTEKKFIKKETLKGIGCKYYINLPSGELHNVENSTTCKNTLPPSGEIHHDLVENSTTTNTNTNTITNTNIYTSSEDEDSISYFERINKEIDDLENEINKELENDLLKKIKSKYSKELIKDELDKLKNKDLSKLDLLIELEKNLKSKKKEIKEECSKDIKTIFDCWNSKGIIKHKTLSPVIKKSIEKVLKDYKLDEIVQAINIYSEILNSQFYFNYKWSLSDFLNRKNGISTFMKEGSNKVNYEEWKKGEKKNGNTKWTITKDRGRFTEGSEEINYKPEEYKGPSYTEEDYKRMYESGELI